MNPVTVSLIVGLISLSILFVSGYILWIQYRNKKALVGKSIATILTPAGRREDKLLITEGNQLWDNLNGKNFPYMIRPDKSFDVWWPFGRPKLLQVLVKSFLYAEGNPEPIDPFQKPPVMTSEVLGNLQDINFSKAMVGRTEELVGNERSGRSSSPLILYIMVGLSVLASLAAVLMVVLLTGGN